MIKPLEEKRFQITYDVAVAELLTKIKSVIAISTYQAGKVIFIGSTNTKSLYQIPISFKKPMGIAKSGDNIAVATLNEIQIFSASEELAKSFPDNPGAYDKLYLPRAIYYNGETDLHDIAFGEGGLWAVNTRFSCLSTFGITHSFTPRWKPPFITDLTPEDRCHLNGMAMVNKKPAFVTALSQTNTRQGWRADITNTGVLMKVPSGEIILDNLAMPHSPRMINGQLYLLQSATGELVQVDIEKKQLRIVLKINGFIRGLTHYDHYLFIGLSKVRESSKTFNKLPVSQMAKHAGVIIYDLEKNKIVGEIKYQTTVDEIYDVQILPDTTKPGLISPYDDRHRLAVTSKHRSFWKKQNNNKENT